MTQRKNKEVKIREKEVKEKNNPEFQIDMRSDFPIVQHVENIENMNIFRYNVVPLQLGMNVYNAASLVQKYLDRHTKDGARLCHIVQCNISEAVLIFERRGI